MAIEEERCAEYRRYQRIDAAFRAGDLAALRAAIADSGEFPNYSGLLAIGSCLEYAIYHSPVPFIRELLDAGADPNPADHAGFPPIIAALSCTWPVPGSAGREDVHEIVELLLAYGSDPNQRGHNDYTPLHCAAGTGDVRAIEILLAGGADRTLRTRIDDFETPADVASKAGHSEAAQVLMR
ncbi:MAG TPA: ankyrin repeat domain-containing protein [Vicinamibacterales bacterium]